MYDMVHASTQGYDHIKHDIPCQDSGQFYESDYCKIFVVADGHGDSNCPRSQIGSETACDISITEMKKFYSDLVDTGWEEKLYIEGEERDLLVRQLFSSIVAKWIKAVNEDLDSRPLTEKEKSGCDRYIDSYEKGERLEHIYGTTLIAGLLTNNYLLLLQQGDGRCVVFDKDGNAIQPIPWDEKCFANITTSLCDEDSIQRFRYAVVKLLDDPVIACFAGSDGVEDAFSSMDLMYSYYRELLIYASENGVEGLNNYLSTSLPEFSKTGSGDDVTIGGFIDEDRLLDYITIFKRNNKIVHIESRISELEDRIKSMNGMGKLDALKKRFEDAKNEINEADKELAVATSLYDSYSSNLEKYKQAKNDGLEWFNIVSNLLKEISPSYQEELEKKVLEYKEKKEQAELRLKKAKESIIPIEQEYREYLEKKESYEKEKEEAEQLLINLRNS